MELDILAAKQKRLISWQNFLKEQPIKYEIKVKTQAILHLYAELLFTCWKKRSVDAQDLAKLDDFERQLEQLNEESRFVN